MAGRTHKTEAIVLRSMRFSEADRILHLYTEDRGRLGAIAKGIRKTKSRFGARLEPLSHVELMLHEGSGELQTITGVQLLNSHHAIREDGYRLNVGMIGAEAMLRLFAEPEANERAFGALARFLDLLDETPPATTRPAVDALGLSFQLKLLWLAGYLPHLTSCVECGAVDGLIAFSPALGRRRLCRACAPIRSAFPRKGLPGSNGCSRRRSPTRPPRASPTGPGATRSRSSPPRTRSTAASACGPCRPDE